MKKKQKIIISLISISILIIILYSLGIFNFKILEVVPSANYDYLGTVETSNNTYDCKSSECIVYGIINITKPTPKPIVIFRQKTLNYNSGYIEIEIEGQWLRMDKYSTGSYTCPTTGHTTLNFTTPEGYNIKYKSGRLDYIVVCVGNSAKQFRISSILPSTDRTFIDINTEKTKDVNIYTADFKFCPSSDVNFPYCTGANSTVNLGYNSGIISTIKKKLITNERINFNPIYPNTQPLTNHKMYIELYDGSCINKIKQYDGTACDPTESFVLCKPSISQTTYICSSGYTFKSSTQCSYYNSVYDYYNTHTNVCYDSSSAKCVSPITQITSSDYTKYSDCVSDNQTLTSGVKCGDYNSKIIQDTSGKKCISKSTNQIATSQQVGYMGCIGECTPGKSSRSGTSGSTFYSECVSGSSCPYTTEKTCPIVSGYQLVYNNTLKQCTLNQNNKCSLSTQTECSLDKTKIRRCSFINIIGVDGETQNGYQWQNYENCNPTNGDLKCNLQSIGDTYPSCGCKGVDTCTPNLDVNCLNENSYNLCTKKTNECNKIDTNIILIPDEGEFCNNQTNRIEDKNTCKFNTILCESSEFCNTIINPDGICQCKNDDIYCGNGVIIPLDKEVVGNPYQYKTCTKDIKCYNWTIKTCPPSQIFDIITHKCQNAGCGSINPDPNLKCSTLNDTRNTPLEKCENNICVQPTDEYSATSNQNGNTKCVGNIVYYVKQYVDNIFEPDKLFYRWEVKTDAQYSDNGVCKSDFSCGFDGSYKCIPNNQFVILTSDNSYAVGSVISNINLKLTDKISNKASSIITAQLFDPSGIEPISDIDYQSINGKGVSGSGELKLNFGNYKPKLVGNYTVKVLVIDYTGNQYSAQKNIYVAKTIKLSLNCPTSAVINRDITCTIEITDASCSIGSYCNIQTRPNILIKQGGNIITDYQQNPSSTGGIDLIFKSASLGTIDIYVNASTNEFISASVVDHTQITSPTINPEIKINNKDYQLAVSSSLEKGTHSISIEPLESGVLLETSTINILVTNPSSGVDTYTLSPGLDNNIWTGSITLSQAGQTYPIKIHIIPTDPSKRADPNNDILFSVTTLKSETPDWWSNYAIIIAIVVGLIILLIIIIFVIIRARKPKINTIPIGL